MFIRFFILFLFLPLFLFSNVTQPLIITGDKDYAPYTYLDSENKAQGLLVDIWKEWSRVNGIPVKFQLKEWRQSIDAIKNKEVDIHSGSYSKVTDTHRTKAIYKSETSLFGPKDYHLELNSQRVGVIDPYFGEVLKKDYPKTTIVPYDNYDDLFKEIKNDKLDLFFDTRQSVFNASSRSSLDVLFGLVRHLSDTVHSLQQERGASAGFIGSNGKKFYTTLKHIRKESDTQIKNLFIYFNLNSSVLKQYFNADEYTELNTKFNHLYLLRKNIDSLTIDFSKSYSKYTQNIASILLNIADDSDKVKNKQVRDTLYVYSTLLMYKESIGQKRAALSSLFSKNNFSPEIFEYYLTADTQEKIYLKIFKRSAKTSTMDFYNKTMNKELLLKIKAYEKLGVNKLNEKKVDVDPEAFFEDISHKINQVQKVEAKLAQKLIQDIEMLKRDKDTHLTMSTPYKTIPLSKLYFFEMFPLVHSPAMAKKINEGFKKVSKSKLEAIEAKWFPENNNFYSSTIFTKEELKWIKEHKLVHVGGESDWVPFDFVNSKGQYDGYAHDYLNEIEKISGLKFEMHTGANWAKLLKDLKEKKLDMLPAIYYAQDKEKYIDYSLPYLKVSDYIYINKKSQRLTSLEDLKGKSIAAVKGYSITTWLRKKYPEIKLVIKPNILEAIIALDTKEVDAFIGDNISTDFIIKENLLKNVKISSDLKEKKPENIHIGLHKDNPVLLSIINKSLHNISKETKDKIQNKWSEKIDNALNKNILNIAVGYNRPPFMFGTTSQKGIELDLASKALALAGYKIGDIHQVSFSKAATILQKNKNIDVAVTVQKIKDSGLFYSEPFMSFDNVVITRKKDKLIIDNEDDLMDKTISTWIGANKVLTPRFHELFKEGAPTRTDKYKEIVDQTEQHRLFFTEQVEAIVVDKTIFEWQKYNFKDQYELEEEYEVHDIFPKKTYYYVAFKNEKIRDMFNKALNKLKKEDSYKKVYKHYVEGKIELQLEIANLITQISAQYIFYEKTDELEKILQAFIKSIPSLHTIDVYDEDTNTLFLQVKHKDIAHKDDKLDQVTKDSFYVGEGNPLKVGYVKLSFDYENVKNLKKDDVPYLSTFSFLDKKQYKRIENIYVQYKFLDKKIELSKSEKEWIKLHPVIKFTGDPGWLPFEAFNEKGKYIGIVAEYLDKLEELTGLVFSRVPTSSWSESTSLSTKREVDVLSETTESGREGLIFTDPYISNEIVIVMKKDHRYVEGLAVIQDQKIALIKDYGYTDQIKQKFPKIPFVTVDTVSEGLTAVSTGKIDALVCSFALGSYTTTKMGLSNIKIVGKTEFKTSLGLGIRDDYKPLVTILNRAIGSITQEEHNEIFNHWIKQDYVEKVDYALLYKVVAGAFILFLMFIIWNRKMAQEIDKRKEIEDKLQDSSMRMSTLFDASPDSISIINANGVYVDCNEATLEIYGVNSKDDFIGTKPEQYSSLKQEGGKLSSDLAMKRIEDVFTKGNQKFDWIAKRINTQELFNVEVILSAISLDNEQYMYAVVRDISDRKLLENTIKESQQQFTSMASNVPGVLYRCKVDAEWTMFYISSEIEKLSGYPVSDFINNSVRSFADIMHEDDIEPVAKLIQDQIDKGDKFLTDYRVIDKHGVVKWVRSQGQASKSDDGDLWLDGVLFDVTEQRALEQLIKENTEQMTFVSEHANFGFWTFNPQVGDLLVNDVFVKMLGYDADEVLKSGYENEMFKPFKDGLAFWEQLLHPDDVERTGKIITAHINGETELYKADYRMRRADGSWMWSTAIGRIAEYDSDGRAVKFNGVNIDIDDVKEAQLLIEQQQQKFESMVSNVPGAIYRVMNDSGWPIIYISDEIENITGYPASDFMESKIVTFSTIMHPDDVEPIGKSIQEQFSKSNKFVADYRVISKSGNIVWVRGKGQSVKSDDGEDWIDGIVIDITKEKKAQQEIEDSKKFVQTLMDSQEQLIITTNGQTITSANQTFSNFYNVKNLEEFKSTYDVNCICDTFNTSAPEGYLQIEMGDESWIDYVIARSDSSDTHKAMISKDDVDYIFSVSAAILPGEDGLKSAVFTNITEMEWERSRAEAATKSKSEFLANMSHEIRTPMNGIIGMTHLALQTELNDKQKNYLQKVDHSAKSLLGIINDILDFSKIEAGKLNIEKIDFDMYKLIEGVIQLIEIKAEEKKLEVIVGYGQDVGKDFFGDSLRISQILTNLLGNAIKFTDKGEVSVYIEKTSTDRFRFEVRDTGIGLSPAQVEKLFKSFSQADGSTTRKYGGTGLGLTISKQLVELMNGKIWVESEEGVGSRFIFEIDLKEKENSTNYNIFGDKNILVVDDNRSWHTILTTTLDSFGLRVDHAYNGEEAVTKVLNSKTPYDLILMDWNMPELNGIEATSKIKASSKKENIPMVVMISAYHEESIVQAAKDEGIDIFLQKPVNPSVLNDILSGLFLDGAQIHTMVNEGQKSLRHEMKTLKGSHILLAEDNETNQEIMTGLLEESGIIIDIANNGQEALDKYTANPKKYELIFMDLQMPVMDGYEATRAIRTLDKEIQIIALTANAMVEDIVKTQSVGMNEHLNKPIEVEKLYATLLHRLSKKVTLEETVPDNEQNDEVLEVEIPGFDHIDTEQGLEYLSGNKKVYLSILGNFLNKYRDLDLKVLDDKAFARTTHTLKGLSASIGARTLNEVTTALDKTQDRSQIDAFNAVLTNVLDELSAKLMSDEAEEDNSSKMSLNEADEAILFTQLEEALNSMEPELCTEIIRKFKDYALPPALKDTLDKIETLADEYDFDEATEFIKNRGNA